MSHWSLNHKHTVSSEANPSRVLLTQPDPLLPAVAVPLTSYLWGEGDEWWGCCVAASPLNPRQRLSPPPVTRQGRGNPIITRLHGTPPAQLPTSQMFPIKKEAFQSEPIFCMLGERARERQRAGCREIEGLKGGKNYFILIQKGRWGQRVTFEKSQWLDACFDRRYLRNGRCEDEWYPSCLSHTKIFRLKSCLWSQNLGLVFKNAVLSLLHWRCAAKYNHDTQQTHGLYFFSWCGGSRRQVCVCHSKPQCCHKRDSQESKEREDFK